MSPDKSIERYSMWLFSRYEDPQASLTEIFDLVKAKNPVSSQLFTYPQFLKLFDQWQENQRHKPLKVKMNERLAANPPTLGVMKTSTGKTEFGSTTVIISTEPDQNAAKVETIPVAPSVTTGAVVAGGSQRQVVEYKIVNEFILDRFVEVVNEAIEEGWEPLGGVTRSTSGSGGTGYYLQAMVKYSDEPGDTKKATDKDKDVELSLVEDDAEQEQEQEQEQESK